MHRQYPLHAVLWFVIGAVALAAGLLAGDRPTPAPKADPCPGPLCPAPAPAPTPAPAPAPPPHPCPGPGPCPRMDEVTWGPSQVGNRTSPDGAETVCIDLPDSQHVRNIGGRDGSGCCVFASGTHAGRWCNEPKLFEFMATVARNENGGGYPAKVNAMMAKYAPGVRFCQYEGSDLGVLRSALAAGRYPCITYGYSPRYGGLVSHMVNLAHLSESWAAIHDNNFPGTYEWMTPVELQARYVKGGGGWMWCPLGPPPPPVPVNATVGPVSALKIEADPPGGNCFGVDAKEIRAGDHYSVDGQDCEAATFGVALSGGPPQLCNASMPRLTVVGTPEQRAQLLRDLGDGGQLASWRGRVLLQAYAPSEWAVSDTGLAGGNNHVVVLQLPPDQQGRGKVVYRAAGYHGGPAKLAAALRKADPSYDPNKDPGPDQPAPVGPLPFCCPNLPAWAWALLAVASYAVTYHGGGPLLRSVLAALRRALAGQAGPQLTADQVGALQAILARLAAPAPAPTVSPGPSPLGTAGR